jgi:hypothetical protein
MPKLKITYADELSYLVEEYESEIDISEFLTENGIPCIDIPREDPTIKECAEFLALYALSHSTKEFWGKYSIYFAVGPVSKIKKALEKSKETS